MTFMFPFPSHSHRIIPIPTHSHIRQRLYIDYLKAKKYVYCVVNSKQNMKLQQKHCQSNSTLISHHNYNYHYLSLFTVQRLSDCRCMLLCKNSRLFTLPVDNRRWEFYCSPIKYAIPIPLELFPFPLISQNYSHSHGNPTGMGIPTA